jgi:hypothetical protein
MLRKALKKLSFDTFLALDRVGLHVLPKHYYTPVPDYQWLKENQAHWTQRAPLSGIEWDLDAQLTWLKETCEPHYHEVKGLNLYHELVAKGAGPGYGPIESQVLHCFVRSLRPRTILEIGSGLSTLASLHASRLNRTQSKLICIEPFPRPAFRQLTDVHHIEKACQATPISVFDDLAEGDLLFIDSSHSVALGSDVVRIYLEIIPRLKRGVYIHIHDIYLPYLYHRTPMSDYFAHQETVLLAALLTENRRLRILGCLSGLHYDRTEELKTLLTDYVPQSNQEGMSVPGSDLGHFPSSLYLQVV